MKEKLTVIKVGGAVVEDEAQLSQLLQDFSALDGKKVLVHGGGRRATQVASQLGIESQMVGGRRITDAAMLQVVTMVYGGLVNKNLVARLQAHGVNALRCRCCRRPTAQSTHRSGCRARHGSADP